MLSIDLDAVEGFSPDQGVHVAFPHHSAAGAAGSATVWINLDPQAAVAEHRDSAEELLLVIEGEIEATVDGETARLQERQFAVVPAMAPHALRNVGAGTARVLGFFAGSTVVSTFTDPLGPDGMQVFVIGAPTLITAPLEERTTLNV
jgi:quercetin dioxygenase-like cupin family protein